MLSELGIREKNPQTVKSVFKKTDKTDKDVAKLIRKEINPQ